MATAFSASRVIHLNHAGASPSPVRVVECLSTHQAAEQALGGYQAAAQVQERLQAVYEKAARLIQAKGGAKDIALVESATVAWTRLFYSFCAAQETAKQQQGCTEKIILISEAEYAANVVAACQWARSNPGWSVLTIPSKQLNDKSTGKVDLDVLQQMLQGTHVLHDGSVLDPTSIALVCITHVPTNSGIVNPAEAVGELIANFNQEHETATNIPPILYLLDSCQSVGQRPVSVPKIQCHGLVATGRKYLRGPRGTGFLYIADKVCQAIMPHHVDHFGVPIQSVPMPAELDKPVHTFLDMAPLLDAKRFEFWESNVAGRLALGEAVDVVLERGIESIQTDIVERADYLWTALQERVPGIKLYHKPDCGICTFALASSSAAADGSSGITDSAWVKEQLWHEKNGLRFEVSVVPATSTPLDSSRMGAPNLLRASVSYTNTFDELDLFCTRLADIAILTPPLSENAN